MKHTCMESVRRGDRRFHGSLHARADGLVDLLFHRGYRAFAHLMACQSRGLRFQGVASDPVALDGRLVAIPPVPVRADADMLEISAALDVEECRATVAVGLLGRFLRQGINALDIPAFALARVGADRFEAPPR